MYVYVDANTETPIKDALRFLEELGPQKDINGDEFSYQTDEYINKGDSDEDIAHGIDQVYTNDESGDKTIYWCVSHISELVTEDNKITVYFML